MEILNRMIIFAKSQINDNESRISKSFTSATSFKETWIWKKNLQWDLISQALGNTRQHVRCCLQARHTEVQTPVLWFWFGEIHIEIIAHVYVMDN